METLELPAIEKQEEAQEPPQATCTQEEIDLAAFRLWKEASVPDIEEK